MSLFFRLNGGSVHHSAAGEGGGGGGGPEGGRAEGAGQVPPDLQHQQGDEEGGASLWQGGQGGEGVRAGVRLRVHLVHY